MGTMGKAYRGERNGIYVLRLTGDIGYPMAPRLELFVDSVVSARDVHDIIIDLQATEHIDSTGLGLVARAANVARTSAGRTATLLCHPGDVLTVLRAMCFDSVFAIEDRPLDPGFELTELPVASASDLGLARVMLGAHRDLMAISEQNRREFEGVVTQLQQETERRSSKRS